MAICPAAFKDMEEFIGVPCLQLCRQGICAQEYERAKREAFIWS